MDSNNQSHVDSSTAITMEYLPSSPCPSASGSELSFASDAESTDYASTPPTSPTRVQEVFRRSLDASSSNGSSPKQSIETLFSNFCIPSTTVTPPSGTSKTYKTPIAPVTPSRTRPMLLSSLSSKRGAHSSPGLLDLSSVPRFPSHPSTSSFSSSTTTPLGGVTPNGSTPKAVPDRPGLFSRWSTDSEGSRDGNDEDGEISACTSPDCEVCEHDRKAAVEENVDMDTDFIRSPLPAGSPSAVASLLPPAPKPHQQGFSPLIRGASSSTSSPALAPNTSSSYFSQQPRHVSSPASLPTSRTCKKKLRNRAAYASSSSSGSSDCFLQTPSDSPSAESPMSSPAIPAGPSKPLTRSQGLRIRDEGSRAKSRWGNRSLSAQISAASASSGSSTIKTASALLEGTISPAATTTDPLRVKLRQLPGAITPDSGMPPSPSPQTGTGIHHNQPHQHHHLYNRSLLTPELPRSPLHISSLPSSSSGNRSPNSSKDSHKDIFSKSFSFAAANANRESPLGSPKFPLPSPRTSVLPTVKENTNPYFAGYA